MPNYRRGGAIFGCGLAFVAPVEVAVSLADYPPERPIELSADFGVGGTAMLGPAPGTPPAAPVASTRGAAVIGG